MPTLFSQQTREPDPLETLRRIREQRREPDPLEALQRVRDKVLTPVFEVERLLGTTIGPPQGRALGEFFRPAGPVTPNIGQQLATVEPIVARTPTIEPAPPLPTARPLYARPPERQPIEMPTPVVTDIAPSALAFRSLEPRAVESPTAPARDPIAALISGYQGPEPIAADTLQPPRTFDVSRLPSPVQGRTLYGFGPYETGYRNTIENTAGMLNRQGVGIQVRPGTPVKAVASGIVESAGPLSLYENHIIVRHPDGTRGVYLYLRDSSVAPGDEIKTGDVLGASGGEQTPEGPHIEFQIRQSGARPEAFDPKAWLPTEVPTVGGRTAQGNVARLLEGPMPVVSTDTRLRTPARDDTTPEAVQTPARGLSDFFRNLVVPSVRPGAPPASEIPPDPGADVRGGGTGRAIGDAALGLGGGLLQSAISTARFLPQLGDVLVPGEGIAHRLNEQWAESQHILDEALPHSAAGRIGSVVGRIGGDVAQIIGTGAVTKIPVVARGLSAAGRAVGITEKLNPLLRLGLVSTPVATAQAFGGEESSTAAAIAMLGETEWGQDHPRVAALADWMAGIADSPIKRAVFEAALDVSLGMIGEGAVSAFRARRLPAQDALDAVERAVDRAEQSVGTLLSPEEARARQSAFRDPVTGEISTDVMDRPTFERRAVEGRRPPPGIAERRRAMMEQVARGAPEVTREPMTMDELLETGGRVLDDQIANPDAAMRGLGHVGGTPAGTISTLAGGGVGAATGAAVDDEDPLRGALTGAAIGAGLGALGSRAAAFARGERGVSEETFREAIKEVHAPTDIERSLTRKRITRPEGTPKDFDEWAMDQVRGRKKPKKIFDHFGLDEQGRQELESTARWFYDEGVVVPKKLTNKETQQAAEALGMSDVKSDWLNHRMDSVSAVASKELYDTYRGVRDQAYKELAEIGDTATRADRLKIETRIEHNDKQMNDLVKMYLPTASTFGRNLQSLKIAARRRISIEDEFGWVSKLQQMADRQLTSDEKRAIAEALANKDEAALIRIGSSLIKEPGWGKSFINLRRAGFLTGLRTQARNAISNLGEAAFRQVDSPVAVWFDKLLSTKTGLRTREFVDPVKRLEASAKGAAVGAGYARDIIKGTKTLGPAELRKVDAISRMTKHSIIGNSYVDFMYRLQGAVDQPWRMMAFAESVMEQSKLLGKDFDQAFEQALKSMEKGLPDDVAIQAMLDGEEAVFQNPTALGQAISTFTNKMPGAAKLFVEYVIPFKQTPSSIFTRIVDRTPIGLLDASTRGYTKLLRAVDGLDEVAIRQLQRDLANRTARGVSGTAALIVGGLLYKQGRASGSWPDDDAEKQLWLQKGKTADAINLGTDSKPRWGRLAGISPIGNLIALGAAITQAMEKAGEEGGGLGGAAGAAATNLVLVGARTARENTFMRGLDDVLKATDPQYGDTMLKRFVTTQGQSFMPILARDVKDVMDPIYREPAGFVEGFKSVAPMWSMDVPVWQDEFGRARVITDNTPDALLRLIDPTISKRERIENDPILKEFDDMHATIPKRQRHVTAGETQDQFRVRREIEGREEVRALEQLMAYDGYQGLNQVQKGKALRAVVSGVREWMDERKAPTNWGRVVGRSVRTALRRPRTQPPNPYGWA